ncbi:hypothetical protein GGX14DRAFT_510310, partial [Mycena pura]
MGLPLNELLRHAHHLPHNPPLHGESSDDEDVSMQSPPASPTPGPINPPGQILNMLPLPANNPPLQELPTNNGPNPVPQPQINARQARDPHPRDPNKLWCSTGSHYVNIALFGTYRTCQSCRDYQRNRRAQNQVNPAAAAQIELQAQVPEAAHVAAPRAPTVPLHFNLDHTLDSSAVTPDERALLEHVRNKLMEIRLEACNSCHEKWFDLGVQNDKCRKCSNAKTTTKFCAANGMDPGAIPVHLPQLTQMEEILISPVHALTQVWQIHGGQYAYRGHICNFPRDTGVFHQKVPLLPEECEIIVFRRSGTTHGQEACEDFRVRKAALRDWLQYLEANHPTFRSRRVEIDWARLNSLQENENVQNRLRSVAVENLQPDHEEGPPEAGAPPANDNSLFSGGFAPNIQPRMTEFEQIQAVAAGPEVILTMPMVRGTPINEGSDQQIAIDAFPTLFPTGKADFKAIRGQKVTIEEWAAHLMRFNDGRFARHPRFRYWALNTIFRKRARE